KAATPRPLGHRTRSIRRAERIRMQLALFALQIGQQSSDAVQCPFISNAHRKFGVMRDPLI
ncbi:hypothetical protein, partial [Enterobacter asburiae]